MQIIKIAELWNTGSLAMVVQDAHWQNAYKTPTMSIPDDGLATSYESRVSEELAIFVTLSSTKS